MVVINWKRITIRIQNIRQKSVDHLFMIAIADLGIGAILYMFQRVHF